MKTWELIQKVQKQSPFPLPFLIAVITVSSLIQAGSSITLIPIIDMLVHPDLTQASAATVAILNGLGKLGLPQTLLAVIVFSLIVVILKNVIAAFVKFLLERIRMSLVQNIVFDEYRSFLGSSWYFFVSQNHGILGNTLIRETEKVGQAFEATGEMVSFGLAILFYLGLGVCISWQITLVILFATLIGLSPFLLLGKKVYQIGKIHNRAANEFQGSVTETFRAAKIILGYGNQARSFRDFRRAVVPFISTSIQFVMIRAVTPLAFEPLGFLILLSAVYLGSTFFHLNISELFLLLYVFKMIAQYALQITDRRNYVRNMAPALEQIYRLKEEAQSLRQVSGTRNFENLREAITLENVDFSYPNNRQVLSGVNLRIPRGKMIAIVGKSGSGKTTLIDILMGFYQVQRGRCRVDGIDLGEFDINSWRRKIGYIPQDAFLFNMSIVDNLLWAQDKADAKEIEEALALSYASEFVNNLPQKLQTVVGEQGVRLSGGQRQRIALARAILRKPELLILDEATSSLDSDSEQLIQKSIEKIAQETTIVSVAHRLSTIKKADYIYVLDNGRIVEEGTFDRLIQIKDGQFLRNAEIQGML